MNPYDPPQSSLDPLPLPPQKDDQELSSINLGDFLRAYWLSLLLLIGLIALLACLLTPATRSGLRGQSDCVPERHRDVARSSLAG